MVGLLETLGFRMIGLLETLGFRIFGLLEAPGSCMVGLSEVSRYSYSCTLKVPPVFVWLDS